MTARGRGARSLERRASPSARGQRSELARLTVPSMRLVRIDAEKGLLLIRGAVPGRRGGMVVVQKAVKK